MAAQMIGDKVLTWAQDLDAGTIEQAMKTAELDVVSGHVALMADAHLGYGCAIGSVVPTEGAIIPSAVGVDLGCGMSAVRTSISQEQLPDDLSALASQIDEWVRPLDGANTPLRHERVDRWLGHHPLRSDAPRKLHTTAERQLGSLGSGNHFTEVSVDENGTVWVVVHSGSRGVGNQLAQGHIKTAAMIAQHSDTMRVDPELAWLVEGTEEFRAYVSDLRWAQAYALENREILLDLALRAVVDAVGTGHEVERIRCHHNYAEVETHYGRDLWITRKGAIRAARGDAGIIPGSMGTDSFIVEGLGHPESYHSSSHGAGRKMSRNQARKQLSVASLQDAMQGKAWLATKADRLLDEHPDAYKDIHQVMAAQSDLVRVRHRLHAVVNHKGT